MLTGPSAERAATEARIFEQILDQARHAPRRIADHLEVVARLVVGRLGDVLAELVGESRDMAQRRAQVVRNRIAERLQFAIDFGNLLDLGLEIFVELADALLVALARGDVADREQDGALARPDRRHRTVPCVVR